MKNAKNDKEKTTTTTTKGLRKEQRKMCAFRNMKKKDEKNKFKNSRAEQIQYHNSILTVSTSAAGERERL